eukprot:gnl/TRDRNA2_/TRDRNA2_88484_c0_seq4.p1 gnl/TRDRNA2_/TRDRNA2_88484_c0~~gnl/TRDRNA2_/TRDRNA2_88484_c0_seq4.p1  ORF type:complete len:250 (+),score=33.27 gnl/TRDRNA2_/TRDRNA2_88484_c0_seq4:3-752(+)
MLSVACNAQSFRFVTEDCQLNARSTSHLRGNSAAVVALDLPCPFAASNRRLHGRVLNTNAEVIRELPPGSPDALPLSLWLEAAGVHLDEITDAPEEDQNATFRSAGLVLLVTFAYHNRMQDSTLFDYWTGAQAPPMAYDIEVRRVAEAGYHVSRATVHEDAARGVPTVREVRSTHGILFQFELSGRVGRFSWQALADQFVLKLGWLTILQLILDLFWQYALPFLGKDYNREVYKWKVSAHRSIPSPKEC